MPIRIIFLGTPEFACPFLQALSDESTFDVVQVITQPDKPAGRGQKLQQSAVKENELVSVETLTLNFEKSNSSASLR